MAAKNMYGIPTPYEDTYAMKNTMNFFGLPAFALATSTAWTTPLWS